MVKRYKEAGYSTIFITDHFQPNSIDTLGDIPWTEKTAIFLSGYYRAKAEGDKVGLTVLPGAEFTFPGSPNHYLAYGITKAFLDAYPEIHKLTVDEFIPIAKENRLFLIQAHPYRDGNCYPTPQYVAGLEICNSNPRHHDYNEKAAVCAKEFDLLITAGSDAHRTEDVAGAGIRSPFPVEHAEDYIRLLQSGVGEIFGEEPA